MRFSSRELLIQIINVKSSQGEQNMTIELLGNQLTPAEGESTVKTYFCTFYRSRLLGLSADGYLAVTNKRVLFHADGTSNAGRSIIQSEIPVQEVSGISSYKGTYFSLGHLLTALVASAIAGGILTPLLGFLTFIDFETIRIVAWILAGVTFLGSFGLKRDNLWRPILVTISAAALSTIGGTSLFSNFLSGRNSGVEFILAFFVILYALACVFWYSRRPTFTLAINAKGGSNTPISISGASSIGIFDMAAGRALNATPAEGAEPMLKELGALILDVQQLGDLGINKWKS